MNVLTGKFTGLYLGEVVDVSDPLNLGRVKVRVRGVFDLPQSIESLPYALPIFISIKVSVGEQVFVLFLNGDDRLPCYFPQTLLSKKDYKNLDNYLKEYKNKYESNIKEYYTSKLPEFKISIKNISIPDSHDSVKKSILLYSCIDTEKVKVNLGSFSNVKEYKIVDSDLPFIFELDRLNGNQKLGVYFPSGTLYQINKDGIYSYVAGDYIKACSKQYQIYSEEGYYIISNDLVLFHGKKGVKVVHSDLIWQSSNDENFFLLTDKFWELLKSKFDFFVSVYNNHKHSLVDPESPPPPAPPTTSIPLMPADSFPPKSIPSNGYYTEDY